MERGHHLPLPKIRPWIRNSQTGKLKKKEKMSACCILAHFCCEKFPQQSKEKLITWIHFAISKLKGIILKYSRGFIITLVRRDSENGLPIQCTMCWTFISLLKHKTWALWKVSLSFLNTDKGSWTLSAHKDSTKVQNWWVAKSQIVLIYLYSFLLSSFFL